MNNLRTLMRKGIIFMVPNTFYLKTTLSNGAYVFGKNASGFGGRGAFIKRDYAEPELAVLEQFIDPDNVFIDIGANTGIYSMKAAKILNDSGVVISCEPFIGVFESLIKGVKYNKFNNVRLRNLCVGKKRELRRFYQNFNKPNSFSLNQLDNTAKFIDVLVVGLDELVEWEALNRVDYIKIDAEGSEEDIINSSLETIKKFKPIIQMETIFEGATKILSNYSCFLAPKSPNHFFIPKTHKKISLPAQLGWKEVL